MSSHGSARAVRYVLLGLLIVCSITSLPFRRATEPASANDVPVSTNTSAATTKDETHPAHVDPSGLNSEAEKLRTKWTIQDTRLANKLFERAAEKWLVLRDFNHAAAALLNSADGWFGLSDFSTAIKRYQRAASLARQARDRIGEVRALSRLGRVYSYLGDNVSAQKQLVRALKFCKTNEFAEGPHARVVHAEVLATLGEVSYAQGDLEKAIRQLEQALTVSNDPVVSARIHLFSGYIAGSVGQSARARSELSRALGLYRANHDLRGEALTLSAIGLAHSLQRDEDRAISLQREALEMFRQIGDRHGEAITLNALGQAYENLNEFSISADNYEQALHLFHSIGALDLAAVATYKVATVNRLNGKLDEALSFYQRCLYLSRLAGKKRTEANALTDSAAIYALQGKTKRTLEQYHRVLDSYRVDRDLPGQATALNLLGGFLFNLGRKHQALGKYRQALQLSERGGDKGLLVSSLYNLARAHRDLGSLEIAHSYVERSLNQIERLRTNVSSLEFRSSYFASTRQHYELGIDILMKLDRAKPGKNFAQEALLLSERSRARSLLDSINESEGNLRQHMSPQLIEREEELRGLIRSMAQSELNLSSTSSRRVKVSREMTQLRSEYEELQAQLRGVNKDRVMTKVPGVATLDHIQNHLLGADTMLLEYTLGDERSYLWAITSNSFRSFELPAREIIETATREVYSLTTARQRLAGDVSAVDIGSLDRQHFEKSARLSRMLLSPIADQLGNKRLVIVVDGALQYLPFDCLPIGSGSVPLLIETNEIVRLPSITTLLAIRTRTRPSPSLDKVAAVIADPVFGRDDDRIERGLFSISAAAVHASRNVPARLSYAAAEVAAVSSVAPRGTTIIASGFEASRENVMRLPIGQYQIVHFATHAFLDPNNPGLSGLLLTMVDKNGDDSNGLMPLNDVYSLDLGAELTVLSACQTGLGQDVQGEGLVGLTYGFLSAGSNSVVASLWKVDDRATANLMTEFYKLMLDQDMTPSTALRVAKLKLMRNSQWNEPYYWAGFVLQGEYMNRIQVERAPPQQKPKWFWLYLIVSIQIALLLGMWRSAARLSPRTKPLIRRNGP